MKEIEGDFRKDMEVMEKMKDFRLHVNDAVAAGAGITNNNNEDCMQDIVAMNRIISLRTKNKEHKLGN
jgi:hypothetical protein